MLLFEFVVKRDSLAIIISFGCCQMKTNTFLSPESAEVAPVKSRSLALTKSKDSVFTTDLKYFWSENQAAIHP